MKISDWTEVSDSFVDGELSEEEKSEVASRAATDDALREEIEQTTKLHEKLAAVARVGRPLPEGFSERLLSALDASPAWSQYGGAIETRKVESRASRRAVPVLVAACVVIAVVAASIAGIANLRKSVDAPEDEDAIAQRPATDGVERVVSVRETAPRIMTPSPEGNAPESVAIKPSQSQFWTNVSFAGDVELKKGIQEFQRLCARQKIRFEKYGGDREFALQRVMPSQWRALSEWLAEASATLEKSEALEEWGVATDEKAKAKNLRVTFGAASVETSEKIEEE